MVAVWCNDELKKERIYTVGSINSYRKGYRCNDGDVMYCGNTAETMEIKKSFPSFSLVMRSLVVLHTMASKKHSKMPRFQTLEYLAKIIRIKLNLPWSV